MSARASRRRFIQQAAFGGLAAGGILPRLARGGASPNEKLNLGIIGTAHRASDNIAGVRGENIVALCDVDDQLLGQAGQEFPQARKYQDFRKLLDQPGIDAVVVSTPDHLHIPASVLALQSGRHVYCEKPLAHSVWEARLAAETARRSGLATQMGTQIHAEANYRRVVELIQAGAIGPVTECYVWCGKTWSGGERPTETPPVPAHLNWDLWLGPAPHRPYHPTYQPANWRRWWDFGSGTLGDMGCHYLDLPFWALKLRHPESVDALGPPVHPETTPEWMVAGWNFPARDGLPPLRLEWHDGGKQPAKLDELAKWELPRWDSGVLFVGEKGVLQADYSQLVLAPAERFKDYERPAATIPDSIGHYAEWIAACKNGTPTTCNFDYSGALTETVLLGMVAFRTGEKLEWDAEALRATNCSAADEIVRREYRQGWELATR